MHEDHIVSEDGSNLDVCLLLDATTVAIPLRNLLCSNP